MHKFLSTACAVALVATTVFAAAPTQARANDVGVGIAAGIVGGTILGAAIASQPRERVYVEERPRRVYEEEDVTVCKKVLYEDEDGARYWKRVCHRR